MGIEEYRQVKSAEEKQARVGYDWEHTMRGNMADIALRDGSWQPEFSHLIYPKKFITDFYQGDMILAAERFGFSHIEDLEQAMLEKAEKTAKGCHMSLEALVEAFPGYYL